ncbi:Mitochondrial 28S ribosomal protein S31 [Trinorchestia longiramus]|nr:Mitochondrial 28S ribosomal protein S31 [Trinorchestia longiramus]
MLRSIPALRWNCEVCRVSHWTLRSSSSAGSNGASSDGPSEQVSEGQGKKNKQSSVQDKKIASPEEVKSKLSSLLSSLKVANRVSDDRKELQLATHELKRVRKPEGLKAAKQVARQKVQAVGVKMAKAVESVVEEVGGGEQTEKELLESLRRVRSDGTESSSPEVQQSAEAAGKLKSALSNLSVEKRSSKHTTRRSVSILSSPSLFGAEPLNIFPPMDDNSVTPSRPTPLLPTWEAQVARDLRICLARPPDSHFQELINWTEQGKIWQFPVNNELGMDAEEEAKVGFQDHIFLERHLSPWCPKKGPIAHFMELVCVGLSKNPYITAQRKKETIFWYRDYFESKMKLLQEIGAVDAETASEEQKQP